jgi:hypothetical protein
MKKNKNKKSFKFAALQVKMKMLHFFWGFNGVSSETSIVYVRTYNFRPNELERYNYFVIYAMKKNKNKKSFKFAALQEHESAAFHLGFQQGFV